MCGIVGAIAQRDVSPILLEGLRRLEYRGYDSAGMAVLNGSDKLERVRILGKVQERGGQVDHGPDVLAADVFDPDANGFNIVHQVRKSKVVHNTGNTKTEYQRLLCIIIFRLNNSTNLS